MRGSNLEEKNGSRSNQPIVIDLRQCPFKKNSSEINSPPSSGLSVQERLELLKAFIGDESFICPPATRYHNLGKISYVALERKAGEAGFLSQMQEGAVGFSSGKKRALVFQFPEEPASREELEGMKQEVCASFFASLCLVNQDPSLLLAFASKLSKLSLPKVEVTKDKYGILMSDARKKIIRYLSQEVKKPSFSFETSVISFMKKLFHFSPNVVPVIENGRDPNFTELNVLSPLFHHSSQKHCPVAGDSGLDHGSFSPSSCLVVLYEKDIEKSRATELGQEAKRRLARVSTLYNTCAPDRAQYDPGKTLCSPYELDRERIEAMKSALRYSDESD